MSDCTFCGKSAGLFKSKHPECEARHRAAPTEIRELTAEAAIGKEPLFGFRDRVEEMARVGFLDATQLTTAISEGFTGAVNAALEDNMLSQEEDEALGEFMQKCGLSQAELDLSSLMRLGMAAALRDVMEGKVPERLKLSGELPFNLEADEQLVWLWAGVQLGEEKTYRTRVGGYGGPSVRIARGMYWRMGGFASQQIEHTAMQFSDKGVLAATTDHLYFKGEHKSLKIPYSKIISWDAYNDGIGICQEGARAKPQVFVTGEGWFIYNLVRNLAQRQAEENDGPAPRGPSPRQPERTNVVGFGK